MSLLTSAATKFKVRGRCGSGTVRDRGSWKASTTSQSRIGTMNWIVLVVGINPLDGKNLPSRTRIAAITADLLRLLFPGFFDDKLIHSSELKVETATLMDSVRERLEDEIYKSLEYAPPPEVKKKELRPMARSFTGEFLASLPRVRELLQTDVEAAYNGDPAALTREEVIVAYPFVETIAVQRLARALYCNRITPIPRLMTESAHGRPCMD